MKPERWGMNSDFENLRDDIRRVLPGSELRHLSERAAEALQRVHPDLPAHYIGVLRHVGWGNLGPGRFMLYSGPCAAESVFGPSPALAGILLIGDDFAGWCLGFDTLGGWRLVGVDGTTRAPHVEGSATVSDFLARLLADEANI